MRFSTFYTIFSTVIFTISMHIATAQCILVANSTVNISMPPTCTYAVTPSNILVSGTNCPGGNLVAEILQSGVWVTANLNVSHIGQTLSARVRDLNSGNMVLTNLVVQDKTAPVLSNCANLTVNCEDACQPIPTPTISDCSTVSLSTNNLYQSMPCTSTFSQRIVQTYTATDLYNNSSSCTRSVNYVRRAPSTVVFPSNITLQLTGTNCSPWCNNGSGNPSPTLAASGSGAFGSPLVDGSAIFPNIKTPGTCVTPCVTSACQLTTTYTDVNVTICGTNRRIDRTWQVNAACGTPAIQTYLQRIWINTDGNTSCGAACSVPFNLNQSYSSSTGLTTFTWSVPGTTCVVRYDIQYRVKIGGVWQAWVTASPGTNSYQASLPNNVPAEWKVRTRCNGINSAYSPVKSFNTNSLVGGGVEERDEPSNEFSAVQPAAALEIFPSPNYGAMTFNFNEPVNESCEFTVSDLQGRLVYRSPLMEGMLSMDLELGSEPGGVYVARVAHPDGKNTVSRFVILK